MGREKVLRCEEKIITYSEKQWTLLKDLRNRVLDFFEILKQSGITCKVYGSVARGDVNSNSDIDIVILQTLPSYKIEVIFEQNNLYPISRKIIQATPNDLIKVNYSLEDDICVTLILTNLTQLGVNFYEFGGAVDYNQLLQEVRVPGIDKRLMLIEPIENGHRERSIMDIRYEAAKVVGISQKIVEQRIRVLERRDKIGRTGVFLERELHFSENVEKVLHEIENNNPLVRKRLRYSRL